MLHYIIFNQGKRIETRGWLCLDDPSARESAEQRMACEYQATEDKLCFKLHLRQTTSILDACQN